MSALKYLKDKEWSFGNGQCPECFGAPSDWHGHPCFLKAQDVGHQHGCKLADALRELGDTPLMIGDFEGPDYECFWTKEGFLDTRIKRRTDKQALSPSILAMMTEYANTKDAQS